MVAAIERAQYPNRICRTQRQTPSNTHTYAICSSIRPTPNSNAMRALQFPMLHRYKYTDVKAHTHTNTHTFSNYNVRLCVCQLNLESRAGTRARAADAPYWSGAHTHTHQHTIRSTHCNRHCRRPGAPTYGAPNRDAPLLHQTTERHVYLYLFYSRHLMGCMFKRCA